MLDTSRVRTGFDVELLLGAAWFRTALQGLADAGAFTAPPPAPQNAVIVITGVDVVFDEAGRDLRVELTVDGVPFTLLATLMLSADGQELKIETDVPGVELTVPFDVLGALDDPPVLTKVRGGDGFAHAVAMLANLDLRAGPQSGEPDVDVPRGEKMLLESFLRNGQDLAFGVGRDAFPRLANDLWHTDLRADDGSHPLPNAEDPRGTWKVVRMEPLDGRVRVTLLGEVPIDIWPDAKVSVEIGIRPMLKDGMVTFEFDVDSDVDTGILGDILAGLAFGLAGLLIGALFGGALIGAGIGFVVGVIVVEIVEVIVEGEVRRAVHGTLDQQAVSPVLSCAAASDVAEALPHPEGGGIAMDLLDAIPRSIPIFTDKPDPVHQRTLLVTTGFTEIVVNGSGFAAAGTASVQEFLQPLPVTLVTRRRDPDDQGRLAALTYRTEDTIEHELALDEVLTRTAEAALETPFKLQPLPGDADVVLLGRRLASVCLTPTNVRRQDTVVTDIRFSSGVDLHVPEAVMLQDAGTLVVRGVQLIHPVDAEPYFRAPADASIENNFENLPPF
jgi:hypothetical protein